MPFVLFWCTSLELWYLAETPGFCMRLLLFG